MLLSGYTMEIFRPECNPNFESVHCKAFLNEDISPVLPYLNSVLGGTQYFNDPPEVMFHHQGRIIKIGGREIAINALKDEPEANRILEWLKREINQAWDGRDEITPSFTGKARPRMIDLLRLLPRTNCRKCGLATCTVFATRLMEGGCGAEACPELTEASNRVLSDYLSKFEFD